MSLKMKAPSSDSSLGDDRVWPPGFRFHPTDEELILYYLKRKICGKRLKLNIIGETDVYKWCPEELPGQSLLRTGDRQWFFFSHRDRKYPNGGRSNRATRSGYWKATGKDRIIKCDSRAVGLKKTLVFYRGRAPKGERTNWVMHEYTLDEEELKRCQNVKEYYVLYKIYKKSGAGPKNGEQYGAPFREEDWVDDDDDDDCQEANNTVEEPPRVQHNEHANVGDAANNSQFHPELVDIEEFLNQIVDDPCPLYLQSDQHTYNSPQVISEGEAQSTLVHATSQEGILPQPNLACMTNAQPYDENAMFNLTQSISPQHRTNDLTEVTSAPRGFHQTVHQVCEEENFLEIDDLLVSNPAQLLNAVENNSLDDLDLFHDVVGLLEDDGPSDQHMASYPFPEDSGTNPFNHQFQSYTCDDLFNADQMGGEVLVQEQRTNVLMAPQSDYGNQAMAASGTIPTNNIPVGVSQDRRSKETYQARNQQYSALWAFVESIPTKPAFASEGPLVNRALGRMSSFSRVKFNMKYASGTVSCSSEPVRKTPINKGFLLLSILVVVCAVICWFISGTVRLSKRSVLH